MDEDKRPVNVAAEVKAIGEVAAALAGLDAEAAKRVLRWAMDIHGLASSSAGTSARARAVDTGSGEPVATTSGLPFSSLADLYAAATPEFESDKTLVAAYWAQFGEGKAEFGAQEINAALKNLGHPIANITSAFDNLKARKPAPVMQLKKAGTSKQARKTYKLTLAGKAAVEAMVRQG